DLRRFQTGQLVSAHRYTSPQLLARWVRRRLPLVIVSALALMTVATVAGLALRNVLHERRAAEQSRAEAERLLGFMLGDLHNKLEPLGRLDLLDDLSRQALAHLRQAGLKETPAMATNRAMALSQTGLLLTARGNLAEALEAHRTTLEIFEDL